jgi:outer membrane protein OmpA-like peptidoglycan-associated protein
MSARSRAACAGRVAQAFPGAAATIAAIAISAGAACLLPAGARAAAADAVPAATLAPTATPAPAPPVHVPWTVRHELNRAEALLRGEDARLHVGSEVQVLRGGEQVVLRVPARLLFSPDSESLRPGLRAAQLLSVPTTLLRRRHHLMTRIEVYTDNIGGLQLNEALSTRRAATLAGALLSAGISAHRVQAYGRGASQALSDNDTPEGRTQNRRVEFVFARLGSQAAQAPPGGGAASADFRPAPAAAPAGG